MLDQMEKPYHKQGDPSCQYCDNYNPNVRFPARHLFRVVPCFGSQRINCGGFIHCEAIPNATGGITVKWTCDVCSYTQTEEMFEEIEARYTFAPFNRGLMIVTQTQLDDAGSPPAPGESICEQALQQAIQPRPEVPGYVIGNASACIVCRSEKIQFGGEPKFILCTNCGHSAESSDARTDWPDILKLWHTH